MDYYIQTTQSTHPILMTYYHIKYSKLQTNMITDILWYWGRQVEYATYFSIIAIITLPIYLKKLLPLINKIARIDYQYIPIPFKLVDFILDFNFSKNILLRIKCDSINIRKKPNQWKFIVFIPHLHVDYQAKQPVRIGCDLQNQELYQEKVSHLIKVFSKAQLYPFGIKQKIKVALRAVFTYFSSYLLTITEIKVNSILVQLPNLYHETSMQKVPPMVIQIDNLNADFFLDQEGHLAWDFKILNEPLRCDSLGNPIFKMKKVKITGFTPISLNFDIMFQTSTLEVFAEDFQFEFNSKTIFFTDVIWNEIFCTQSIQRCLKQYFGKKPFLKIGHPKSIRLSFGHLSFNYPLSDHLKYRKDYNYLNEVMQIYADEVEFKFDFRFPKTEEKRFKNIVFTIQTKESGFRFKGSLQKKNQILIFYNYRLRSQGSKIFRSSYEKHDITDMNITYDRKLLIVSPKLLRYITLFKSSLYKEYVDKLDLQEIEKNLIKDRRRYFLEQTLKFLKENDFPLSKTTSQQDIFTIHYKCIGDFKVEILDTSYDVLYQATIKGFEHIEIETDYSRKLQFQFQNMQVQDEDVMTNFKLVYYWEQKDKSVPKLRTLSIQLGICRLFINDYQLHRFYQLNENIQLFVVQLKRNQVEHEPHGAVQVEDENNLLTINTGEIQFGFVFVQRTLMINIDKIESINYETTIINNLSLIDKKAEEVLEIVKVESTTIQSKLDQQKETNMVTIEIESLKLLLSHNLTDILYYRRQFEQLVTSQQSENLSSSVQHQQNEQQARKIRRSGSFDGLHSSNKQKETTWQRAQIVKVSKSNYNFKIKKITVEVEDTPMNVNMVRYRQFQLKYLKNKNHPYLRDIDFLNEASRINVNLLTVEISDFSIGLSINSIYQANPIQKFSLEQILNEIFKIDSHPIDLDVSFFKMISILDCSIQLGQLQANIRDYPQNLINMVNLTFSSQVFLTQLNTSNLALSLRIYYKVLVGLDSIQTFIGLNLIFAARELQKRLTSILGQNQGLGQSTQHSFTRRKNVSSSELNFWDRLRLKFHGSIKFTNQLIRLQMSTDTLPYGSECIQAKFKNNCVIYENGALKAQFNRMSLNRLPQGEHETPVMNIPKVQVMGEFNWFSKKDQFDHYFVLGRPYLNQLNYCLEDFVSTKFQASLKVNCLENDVQYFNKNLTLKKNLKNYLYFHYQSSFFKWIKQLPILRNEILRLYNIKLGSSESEPIKDQGQAEQENAEEQVDDEKNLKFLLEKKNILNYANYFSLIGYTYSRVLESLKIQGSLYQHTECVSFKIFCQQLRLLFSNRQNPLKQVDDYLPFKGRDFYGVQVLVDNIQTQLKMIPKKQGEDDWTLAQESLTFKIEQITGSAYDCVNFVNSCIPITNKNAFIEFFQLKETDSENRSFDESPVFTISTSNIRNFSDLKGIKQFLINRRSRLLEESCAQINNCFLFEDMNDNGEYPIFAQEAQMEDEEASIRQDFNAFALFLSAQDITYEANREVVLNQEETQEQDDKQPANMSIKQIQNFFTIKNSKVLFTFQLQELLMNVFQDKKQIKNEEQSSPEFVKKQETSIIESINQFVRSVADQKKNETSTPEKSTQVPVANGQESARHRSSVILKHYVKTQQQILLLVNLIKPQFNLQYHGANAQMILTSPQDCQFLLSEYTLPFDRFKVDKKRVSTMIFNGLECYVQNVTLDAKSRVRWLEKRGFDKIIHSDMCVFKYQDFTMKENEIDFTETYQQQLETKSQGLKVKQLWNQEMRREVVSIRVGSLFSDMNTHQLNVLKNMLDFVEMATISTQEYEDMERSFKNKIQELNYHGMKNIENLIKRKLGENQDRYGTEKSRLDYQIKNAVVQLLDENNISFLQCKLITIRVIETFYNNESRKSDILIQNVEVINRMSLGADATEYRLVLQQIAGTNDSKKPIFRLVKRYFAIPLYNQQSRWFVYDQYDVKVNPMIIKLTDELYDKFYAYFFYEKDSEREKAVLSDRYGKDKDKIKNISENYKQKIPDLYQSIQIGSLKLNVTFRHPSKLKRLKDVGVLIDQYVMSKVFWTSQELFDDFAAFIIKQVSSQIFSILGQKLFGISREFSQQ